MPLSPPTLQGARVALRPFDASQIGDRYLGWLKDPEVNRYSRRREAKPIDLVEATAYLAKLHPDEHILGIHIEPHGHVGNIKYGPIDWENMRADISILLGERALWGQGVGAEAITLVTRFLFKVVRLHRVDAGSNNPAFLRMVAKLGWRVEGVLRDRIRTPEGFRDHVLVALLAREFEPDVSDPQ